VAVLEEGQVVVELAAVAVLVRHALVATLVVAQHELRSVLPGGGRRRVARAPQCLALARVEI